MDPNANLTEARELATSIVETNDDGAVRLAELVLALDEWITRGGFLPEPWAAAHPVGPSCVVCPTCGDEVDTRFAEAI